MKVLVRYLKKDHSVELKEGTVEEALKGAGIVPQTVISKLNGTIVPDSSVLKDGDKIEAIRVVSGG